MDSETVHGTLRSGAGGVPEAGLLLEVRGLWMEAAEAWRRAAGVAPGQTGSSLPGKGLNLPPALPGKGVTKKQPSLLQESEGWNNA